jgi:hypothetical protein
MKDLKIVKGELTADELAALVAVLTRRLTALTTADRRHPEWNKPEHVVRKPVVRSQDSWRRSSLPS